MNLRQSSRRPSTNYHCLILDHLFRAEDSFGREAISYRDLCERVKIPPQMRGSVLLALITYDYVALEGDDAVSLTEAGRRLAAAPLN
jgi:hypothetical protein